MLVLLPLVQDALAAAVGRTKPLAKGAANAPKTDDYSDKKKSKNN